MRCILTRGRVIFGLCALAVIGAGIAIGIAASYDSPTHRAKTARCYETATTEFNTGKSFAGITVSAPPNRHGELVAPVTACAKAWQDGALPRRGPAATPDPANIVAPSLVGCVLPDHTAGVFPGTKGTCGRLGLQSARVG